MKLEVITVEAKKVSVSILLPEIMNQRIEEQARKAHRTKSGYIRLILWRYMEYLDAKQTPRAKPVDWDIQ